MCTCTHTDNVQVSIISMQGWCASEHIHVKGNTLTCACGKEERMREVERERRERWRWQEKETREESRIKLSTWGHNVLAYSTHATQFYMLPCKLTMCSIATVAVHINVPVQSGYSHNTWTTWHCTSYTALHLYILNSSFNPCAQG